MPAYLYQSNVSPRDRFNQVDLRLDNGSTARIRLGHSYDLSLAEATRASRFIVLEPTGSADAQLPIIAMLPIVGTLHDGDVPVWDSSLGAFIPGQGSGGASGTSSLIFSQPSSSLTESLPWRSYNSANYISATISVTSPVVSNVSLVDVSINGLTVATLGLSSGQTTATSVIDIGVSPGDLVSVERLSSQGGAITVQLDRILASGGSGGGDVTAGELAGAISAHSSDTTAVHGISNTVSLKGVVMWSSGGLPARPSGFVSVEWVGPDNPFANALEGDTWIPTAP